MFTFANINGLNYEILGQNDIQRWKLLIKNQLLHHVSTFRTIIRTPVLRWWEKHKQKKTWGRLEVDQEREDDQDDVFCVWTRRT